MSTASQKTALGLFAAVVAFLCLSLLFSGAPDNAGILASLDPVNAVKGLSFALSFAAGLPAMAAVVVAIAVFVLVPVAVFLIAHRLVRRYDR